MANSFLNKKALSFATQAHAGQIYSRAAYIEHCKLVAARVAAVTDDPLCYIIALLHDVVEDTEISPLWALPRGSHAISMAVDETLL